jgi:hypothetical protein
MGVLSACRGSDLDRFWGVSVKGACDRWDLAGAGGGHPGGSRMPEAHVGA